ncbi:MAG: 2-phosphosulfolactate phosphatase, partial [Cyclobacteriaceae bacterium]|nr:2-phosphosulfolactate phosphatase [Cyclobacteriaceae bacterium]
MNPTVEVCFSPRLYEHKLTRGKFTTVVVDILRASTSICAAFDHGVRTIIPVSGLDEARELKQKGFFVACERNGEIMDFADIGNSASDFIRDDLVGETVVFSTTNGTKTINMARDAEEVLIGSFVNIKALGDYLIRKNENVVIFCAAWKNLFNLEDSVFAGALAESMLNNGFTTVCDS